MGNTALAFSEFKCPPKRLILMPRVGGKYHLAGQLIKMFPRYNTFVEVFGGAANILLRKPKTDYEIYNDFDGDVVNILMQIRDNPKEFENKIKTIPYSRQLYRQFRRDWKTNNQHPDPLERAARFYFINCTAMVGGIIKSVSMRVGRGEPSRWRHRALKIPFLSNRFQNVIIENRDFRDIIRIYDSTDSFFYLDPPYISAEHYYAVEFTVADHQDLAGLLKNIKGKAMVSYYVNPILDELYRGEKWYRTYFNGVKHSQISNKKRDTSTELVLTNYDPREKEPVRELFKNREWEKGQI